MKVEKRLAAQLSSSSSWSSSSVVHRCHCLQRQLARSGNSDDIDSRSHLNSHKFLLHFVFTTTTTTFLLLLILLLLLLLHLHLFFSPLVPILPDHYHHQAVAVFVAVGTTTIISINIIIIGIIQSKVVPPALGTFGAYSSRRDLTTQPLLQLPAITSDLVHLDNFVA